MNKITMVALPVVLVLLGSSVFAQNPPSTYNPADSQGVYTRHRPTGRPMGMYPSPMDKEKIQKFMQSLLEMGLLYKMLEQPTMVSTEDGFVVAYGNTLRKYDKDLNVVKEVDLDVDVDGMQALASKFAKKYTTGFMDLMDPASGAAPGSSPSGLTSASTDTTAAAPDKSAYDQHEEQIKKEIDQMK